MLKKNTHTHTIAVLYLKA